MPYRLILPILCLGALAEWLALLKALALLQAAWP